MDSQHRHELILPLRCIIFTQLRPILFVEDLAAEVRFYEKLGFKIEFQSPDFVGLVYGDAILFGLQHQAGARYDEDQPVIWQMAVHHIDAVAQLCKQHQFPVQQEPALQSWGEWTMTVISPNGYRVTFEAEQQ